MTKYIINQTQMNIDMTGLKRELPIGGWLELSPEQAKHSDVDEAIRRGWVKISVTKPAEVEKFTPKFDIAEPAVHGSKTIPKKVNKENA